MDDLGLQVFLWNHRPHVRCHGCGLLWNKDDCMMAAMSAIRNGYDPGDMMCPNCDATEDLLEIYFDYT